MESKNPRVADTKNGSAMLSSNCMVWGSNQYLLKNKKLMVFQLVY